MAGTTRTAFPPAISLSTTSRSRIASSRDPLVQLTQIRPKTNLGGHFRGITVSNSKSGSGGVVDFGGGPRTNRTDIRHCLAVAERFADGDDTANELQSAQTPVQIDRKLAEFSRPTC